jgi:iduronate 2-sulfatase
VDVYPTLVDLLGLPLPTADSFPLEGLSLRPLLEQPSLRMLPGRDFALSTYARCPRVGEEVPLPNGPRTVWNTECIHDTERSSFPYMGYTIRVDNYRYTEFVRWNGSSLSPIWGEVLSRELYNHTLDVPGTPEWEERDDFEDINRVLSAPQELVSQLAEKLRAAFGAGGRPVLK